MAVLKILIAILILLFPLGELGRINIYNEISTTLNDILVAIVVFTWLGWMILTNKLSEISKKKLAKPILFFIFIAFISLIFNYNSLKVPEFIASFLYLLRFIAYAGIYFVISGFDLKFKQKILALMIISGTLIVAFGFVQYFLYPNLRNLYYLGWDEHLYRLFSSFLDPNFAASIISLLLVLCLSMLFLGFSKSRKTNLFLVFLAVIGFIALLLTYSRSGYLMFSISAFVLLIILGKKKYIAILILIFAVGIILVPKDLGGEGVKLLRTASFISRTDYANNAITIFKDNPILGVGFNSYRYAQYRYGFIDESNLRTSHAGAGTDNSFLFILATTGVVGQALYLYLWFKIIKGYQPKFVSGSPSPVPSPLEGEGKGEGTSKNDGFKFQKLISVAVIASSAGIFINAFFINSLFYPFVMEWMWILIGLSPSRISGSRDNK